MLFSMLMAFAVSAASASECGLCSTPKDSMGHITEFSVGDKVLNLSFIDTTHFLLNQKDSILSTATPIPENQKKKKRIAALCAFPFPFGFVAAHRVMLGTKPWVPVVYVATFGGCFGLLPLIDFCVISFSKDITQYENNPNIFMWLK